MTADEPNATEADIVPSDAESGRLLAEQMFNAGYQPVVLFGNGASGKTTLLMSLLAAIRTSPQLQAGLKLGEPILDPSHRYGSYLWSEAQRFFGLRTQEFIEGIASESSKIPLPFFIPLIFAPTNKPELKIAFMESNGEWYRADRKADNFFTPLKEQVEDFIRSYPLGILFVHLVPYTQQELYSTNGNTSADAKELSEASLAVSGALQAYQKVRPDKTFDRHIMLVTKWDAHSPEGIDPTSALFDHPAEVYDFVSKKYSQAYSTFCNMGLDPNQIALNGYCAGQISGRNIRMAQPGSELAAAIQRFQVGLWKWLYRNSLDLNGQLVLDPFPVDRPGPFAWFSRLLDKVV
jgi:hypothetical protein